MKKIKLYNHHHRFNYLLKAKILNDSTELVGKCPAEKACLFVADESVEAEEGAEPTGDVDFPWHCKAGL